MAARKLKSDPASSEIIPQDKPGGNTSWKSGVPANGWYRMPDEWWRHLPRLQRGLYQRMLIEYVWGSMIPRQTGADMPDWSGWLSYVDMAAVFRCTPDQLRDDARDASKRGLIAIEESRGRVRFRITCERWPNLKDYQPPRPVAVEKKDRVAPSSRWLAGVTVKPGGSYDFTVPELPADFRLQKISLRNTGDSGELTFAGGGPAEGGILILEAESGEKSRSKEKTSESERESTPARKSASVDSGHDDSLESDVPSHRGSVSRSPGGKTRSGAVGSADQAPQDDALAEALAILRGYGAVDTRSFMVVFRKTRCTTELFLQAVKVITPSETAKDPVAWVLGRIPAYLDGSYNPVSNSPKKPTGAAGRRLNAIEEALRKAREEEKIA